MTDTRERPAVEPGIMNRVLIVSNRLPVTVRINGNGPTVEPSSGGLATGVSEPHRKSGGLWIGWPGETHSLKRAQRRALDAELQDRGLVPIHLTRREVREFYDGISNSMLWPVLQYLIDRLPIDTPGWDTYRSVNKRFAQEVVARYQPGDTIWVHDYHLFLVPQLVREQLPNARIGFFLHIPFPSDDVFGILPWREEILRGLLGADMIGVHTTGYLRHFLASVRRFLRVEPSSNAVQHDGRTVRTGVFPIGVDVSSWEASAGSPAVAREVDEIRKEAGNRHILLGVDRLDYTKGLLRRLRAFERLLERDPALHDQVRLIQVTVPTREKAPAYEAFKRRVDEVVGRINGTFATANSMPIHRLHRSLEHSELAALYRAADVLLVTSLRDGMNLVAKEFVASRTDGDGVLVLSEFTGAADELTDALLVNPYDIDGLAATIERALAMPAAERRARMGSLRTRVREYDVHRWARTFLSELECSAPDRGRIAPATSPGLSVREAIDKLKKADHALLALDYDGTLVPFAGHPDSAAPDAALLEIVEGLSTRPRTTVHIVSGRDRESLQRWFGHLRVGLHGEHGLFSRSPGEEAWQRTQSLSDDWKEAIRPLMQQFVETTRGSFIEEKSSALVWHYRMAADSPSAEEVSEARAAELQSLLTESIVNTPVQIVASKKVVEVRPRFVNKGLLLSRLLEDAPDGVAVLAMGDDRTDEDMFAAAPKGSVTVHVGDEPTEAEFAVPDHVAARALLTGLLEPEETERRERVGALCLDA